MYVVIKNGVTISATANKPNMGKNADQKATLAKKFIEHLKTEKDMRWKEI